ncbi:hypothetical protein GALMADRAFT_48800, partial [Galerina marginata CBS 339.88]
NFSMTDYASQGKTREKNLVDVSNCQNHQSYYTCLSRSACAADTIILKGFDPSKIIGHASGWLRQEFRELELMDYITYLKFKGELPAEIQRHTRRETIKAFMSWKGPGFVPDKMHDAIRWSSDKPFERADTIFSEWKILQKRKKPTSESSSLFRPNVLPSLKLKRKASATDLINKTDRIKRSKTKGTEYVVSVSSPFGPQVQNEVPYYHTPIGLIWDGQNYSCAYDTLFTIIHHIWSLDPHTWNDRLQHMTDFTAALVNGFEQHAHGLCTFESTRDRVRSMLYESSPASFPYGPSLISIYDLACEVLRTPHVSTERIKICRNCQWTDNAPVSTNRTCIISIGYTECQSWFNDCLEHTNYQCRNCSTRNIAFRVELNITPPIIFIDLRSPATEVEISQEFAINSREGRVNFVLRGVVYYGDNHFTCRLVFGENSWFHDGITTKRNVVRDSPFTQRT